MASPKPSGTSAKSVLLGCCTATANLVGATGLKIMPVDSEPATCKLMKWSRDSPTPSPSVSRTNQMSPPMSPLPGESSTT